MKTIQPYEGTVADVLRREIDRFMRAARQRSEFDIDTRRRAMRRYHRSWPLMVRDLRGHEEISAALHDASSMGIGFLCLRRFAVDSIVLVKLFWHDEAATRVPVRIRHVTRLKGAYLNGGEFTIDEPDYSRAGLQDYAWYD